MTQNGTPEGGQETGGEFRQKFEAVQAENQALRTAVTASVAGRFEYVSPEDLAGVEVDQLEAKAQELHESRATERRSILEDGLRANGFTDEQIASIVAGNGSPQAPASTQTAPSVVEQMGQLGGQPVSQQADVSKMSPSEKIAHGIAQRSQRR